MVKTLKMPQLEINLINKLMQLTGKEISEKYGIKEGELFVHTVHFTEKIKVEFKLIVSDFPYVVAIFWNDYIQEVWTRDDDLFEGVWDLENKNEIYIVIVEGAD